MNLHRMYQVPKRAVKKVVNCCDYTWSLLSFISPQHQVKPSAVFFVRVCYLFLFFLFAHPLSFMAQTGKTPIDLDLNFSGGTMIGENSSGLCSGWQSNVYTTPDNKTYQLTLSTEARNMKRGSNGQILLAPGRALSSTYTLRISDGFLLNSLTITGRLSDPSKPLTIVYYDPQSQSNKSFTFNSTTEQTLVIPGTESSRIVFTLRGASNNTDGSINIAASARSNLEQGCRINYILNNVLTNETLTETITYRIGSVMKTPPRLRRGFLQYEYHEDSVDGPVLTYVPDKENCTVHVLYRSTSDLPFRFSTANDTTYWYGLNQSLNQSTLTLRAVQANDVSAPSVAGTNNIGNTNIDPKYGWAFVGDAYDFILINTLEANKGKGLTLNNGNLSMTNSPTHWTLLQNDCFQTEAVGFAIRVKNGNNYLKLGSNNTLTVYEQMLTPDLRGAVNTAEKSAFFAIDKPLQPLVYIVVNDFGEKVEQSPRRLYSLGQPTSLPNAQRRAYCRYGYDVNRVVVGEDTVIVSYDVENPPFEFSPSKDELLYRLWRNGTNRLPIFQKDGDGLAMHINGSYQDKGSAASWAFVGDPYGFEIVNRKGGVEKTLTLIDTEVDSVVSWAATHVNYNTVKYPQLTGLGNNRFELFKYGGVDGGLIFRLKQKNIESGVGTHLYLSSGRRSEAANTPATDNYLLLFRPESEQFGEDGTLTLSKPEMLFTTAPVSTIRYQVLRDGATQAETFDNTYSVVGEKPYMPSQYRHHYMRYEFYKDENHTQPLSIVEDEQAIVYVKEVQRLPFVVSNPSTNDWKWYYIKLRDGKYWTAIGPGPYPATTEINLYEPMSQWAFVGNATEGFYIVNRWYGDSFHLTNPFGDVFQSSTIHLKKHSPMCLSVSEIQSRSFSDRWALVYYNDRTFGLRDKKYPKMNINVYRNTDNVGFFYEGADVAWNSRIMVEPVKQKSQTEQNQGVVNGPVRAQLLKTAKAMLRNRGAVFAFKDSIDLKESDLARMTNLELEELITNPVNLQPLVTGYYILQNASGTGVMQAASPTFVAGNVEGIQSQPNAEASILSAEQNSLQSPSYVFKVVVDNTGYGCTIRSQGLHMQQQNGSVVMNENSQGRMLLFPKGQGQAALIAASSQMDDAYNKSVAKRTGKLALQTFDRQNNVVGWLLRPAKKIKAKGVKVTFEDDYYQGTTFSVAVFDFPIQLQGEDVQALYCSGSTSHSVTFKPLPNNQVPAGVPFIYKGRDDTTELTFDILQEEVARPADISDAFHYVYLPVSYGASLPYNAVRVFSFKQDKDRWMPVNENSSSLTSIGFRKSSNKQVLGPNKGYLDLRQVSSDGEAFAIRFYDNDIATGISNLREIKLDSHYYDLQGRKIKHPGKGIYIYQGKKIVIQ